MPHFLTSVRKPRYLAAAAGVALLLTAVGTGIQPSGAEAFCDADPCGPEGTYTPVTPTRLLDGRLTDPQIRLGVDGTTDLKVTGVVDEDDVELVPATGVSAVVLNLTVDLPTLDSFFTISPTGTATTTSSLNFAAGETRAAATTVKVGTDGMVTITNAFGQAFPIVDIQGYFSDGTEDEEPGSSYVPLPTPSRVVDTRVGGAANKFAADTTKNISLTDPPVEGATSVPAGATAVVANLTVTNTTADGYLTAFAEGTDPPLVSNLNWAAGRQIPNLATIPLSTDGMITVYNSAGATDVLIDVTGYYVPEDDETVGDRFTPVDPDRIGDSRSAIGGLVTFTTADQAQNLKVTGADAAPEGASAVVVSITSDNVTAETFFTAYPKGGATAPNVSNLNPIAGEQAANLAIVRVGDNGEITLLSRTPTANVIVDLYGYFEGEPPAEAIIDIAFDPLLG